MTEASGGLPESAQVGRVALRVNDLAETVEFYRDVVGLGVVSREGENAALGVEDTPLLHLVEDLDLGPRPRESAGLYHTAFRVPTREALGDALDRVREGWRLEGASDHLVSEALYLSDPEGNGVEIYRDRPCEEWPIADDGRVEMDTLPLNLDDLAEESDGAEACPPGTSIGHVHLEVTSLAASRDFYVDALGLALRQEFGDSALFFAAGSYHHHVGANAWQGRTEAKSGRGLDWFELVVPDERALGHLRDRLGEAGIDYRDRNGGIETTDPDEITLRVSVDSG